MTPSGSHFRGRPPRLDRYFEDRPLFFITFATWKRQPLLASDDVHDAFLEYCRRGVALRRAEVGRYVIMPDHIHCFVRGSDDFEPGLWTRGLKRALGKLFPEHSAAGTLFQEGFFDHVLPGSESYERKWEYVRMNPVRAGLVEHAEDWVFAGEVVQINRA